MRSLGRARLLPVYVVITAFDPARRIDCATYEKRDQPSEGIVHALVNGTVVGRNTALLVGVAPGQATRR